ncbi:MAG: hypothetical protein ACFE9R_06840 [Candidatus Hermodarchaeota archaeon]
MRITKRAKREKKDYALVVAEELNNNYKYFSLFCIKATIESLVNNMKLKPKKKKK